MSDDRNVGRELVYEGLWYFERAGDGGDRQYVAAIRAELDRLRAEVSRQRDMKQRALTECDDLAAQNAALRAEVEALRADKQGLLDMQAAMARLSRRLECKTPRDIEDADL